MEAGGLVLHVPGKVLRRRRGALLVTARHRQPERVVVPLLHPVRASVYHNPDRPEVALHVIPGSASLRLAPDHLPARQRQVLVLKAPAGHHRHGHRHGHRPAASFLRPVPPRSSCGPSMPQQRKRLPHRAIATPTTAHSRAPGRLISILVPSLLTSGLPNGTTASGRLRYACLPVADGSAPLKAGCNDRHRCSTDGQASAQSLRSSSGGWGLLTTTGDASSWDAGRPSAHSSCHARLPHGCCA